LFIVLLNKCQKFYAVGDKEHRIYVEYNVNYCMVQGQSTIKLHITNVFINPQNFHHLCKERNLIHTQNALDTAWLLLGCSVENKN